jgi:magnesium transporter
MAEIIHYFRKIIRKKLSEENLSKLRRKRIWIDLQQPTENDLELLQTKLKLHPTTIEDLKSHNSRTKVEEFPNYLSIVLHDVTKKNGEIVPFEVDIIVGKNFVITAYDGNIPEFEDVKKKRRKFSKLMFEGTDALLHFFMDTIMNHYVPIIDYVEDKIDDLEAVVTKTADRKMLNRIIEMRSKIVTLRKIIHPMREKIEHLSRGQYRFIREDKLPYFRDLYDDTVRVSESIDNERESITAVYDLYMSTISYNTNEVMKVLSIAATIMLPLTFITGLFGMNFQYIPGLHDLYGFWVTIGIMVIMVIMLIAFFKKEKWI